MQYQQQHDALSPEMVSQVKTIYHNLLKLPIASSPISLTQDSLKIENDFYLWENYMLFVQLTSKNILELTEAYSYAIERVKGLYERQHLWIKYLHFARHFLNKNESELCEIVQRILEEQHFDENQEQLPDSRLYALLYNDNTSSSKNYNFINKICDDFISPLPDIRKTYYYERILDLYPDNIPFTIK